MDLRSIKLRMTYGHVRGIVADADGEHGRDLEGDPARRIFAAARELLTALEHQAGGAKIRSLSLDLLGRVARLSLVGVKGAHAGKGGTPSRGLRIAGTAFDDLAPLIREVARAAMVEIRPRREDPPYGVSSAKFWSHLYREGCDGWELGRPAPPLARWLKAHPQRGMRALVVGCGRGHEARMFARGGARVVGVDLVPEAVLAARTLAAREGVAVDFRTRDLFALRDDRERYNLVVEHCCFCAIEVERRAEYVNVVADVLVSGGRLVGLFWAHGRSGGPPFSVGRAELLAAFGERFAMEEIDVPRDSVALRAGQEILALFCKR